MVAAPDAGERTLPTHTSSIAEGGTSCTGSDVAAGGPSSLGLLSRTPRRTADRSVEGGVDAKAPLRARQRGVRTELTITTSRG